MKNIALLLAVTLSGCASVNVEELQSLVLQGRCAEAEALAGSTQDPSRYNNIGVVYKDCYRDPAKARAYFDWGARLGNQMAVNNLLRNGWPVPTPDIRVANDASAASRDAGTANAINLLMMAQPKQSAPLIRGTSCVTKFRNGNAYTDCD